MLLLNSDLSDLFFVLPKLTKTCLFRYGVKAVIGSAVGDVTTIARDEQNETQIADEKGGGTFWATAGDNPPPAIYYEAQNMANVYSAPESTNMVRFLSRTI